MSDSTQTAKKTNQANWKKYSFIGVGLLILILILSPMLAKPSAETVFKNALSNMLQTGSVTIEQDFLGEGGDSGTIDLSTDSYMEFVDDDTLIMNGAFDLDLVTDGAPISASAEYRQVDNQKYIKYTTLTSSDSELAASFNEVEARINNNWIIARDNDSFTPFVDIPIDSITTITALPFANVSDEKRSEIVAILQDEESFTITESAKVTLNGKQAYKYVLEYNEDKQAEVSEKLSSAVSYLSSGSKDDSSTIDSLELWIDIDSERFVKLQYSGTSDMGDVTATYTFSKYGEKQDVSKPADYFIESELLE